MGSRAGSGVLGFANIIGWNIALLPVSLGQPPFRISCDVFKVQDLESLVGGHTQFVWVPRFEGIDSKIDLCVEETVSQATGRCLEGRCPERPAAVGMASTCGRARAVQHGSPGHAGYRALEIWLVRQRNLIFKFYFISTNLNYIVGSYR